MKKIIAALAITFITVEAVDAFLTLWATNNGFQEVNPLMVPFAHTWAFPFIKIIPAGLVMWGIIRVNKRYPRTQTTTALGLVGAVAFVTAILISNISEL